MWVQLRYETKVSPHREFIVGCLINRSVERSLGFVMNQDPKRTERTISGVVLVLLVLGCLLVLPLNNFQTGIGNFVTFSEITFNFRVTPPIMAIGIAFALIMGAIGGLFPAASAARKEILTALKQV